MRNFFKDKNGAVGTEYGVLLVIISLGMIVAAGLLGDSIGSALNRAANCLNEGTGCAP